VDFQKCFCPLVRHGGSVERELDDGRIQIVLSSGFFSLRAVNANNPGISSSGVAGSGTVVGACQ
jgi:hypothetical protein